MTDCRNKMSSSVNLKFAMNLMHSSRPAKTVNSPPNGFFLKERSHGSVGVLAGLPVGVGHGELVLIGEQRRRHGVRRRPHPMRRRRTVGACARATRHRRHPGVREEEGF
ncbi:Os04g0429850 [Oryza sativa Japonica Group]|uniref:Os04g0429850 protein n=1 Tax=Oryza sativa subsp. japonica TaxID=39947 RepID=A0A0P0WAL1_ORYSJ|nr:Os04g0429850 [Oryza sativa Japonica Group]